MSVHDSSHQMRWADLDAYGHVNNVVFLRYLQEARVDMLYVHAAAHGAEQLAAGVVVVRNEVEYLRPLDFTADPVLVRTWVARIGGASFGLGYEVTSAADPEVVTARAATTVTPFDPQSGRPRRLEPPEREVLERYLEPDAPLPRATDPRLGGAAPPPPHSFACAVRFDDLDLYGHVNNVCYAEYLQEARVRFLGMDGTGGGRSAADEGSVVVHQVIDHRRPIPFRTAPVTVASRLVGLTDRTWTLAYVVRDEDEVFAEGRSTQVAYDVATRRSRVLGAAERAALLSPP